MNRKVAIWIKARMLKYPQDIWLWGNHDLHYAFPYRNIICSGFEQAKSLAINDILEPKDWDRFMFYCWMDDWLLSHGGLHPSWMQGKVSDLPDYLEEEAIKARRAAHVGERHWFFRAGRARWGSAPFGGLLWLDFNDELVPIPGLNQIVGHTPLCYHPDGTVMLDIEVGEKHGKNSKNYCLDTNNMWYALWNGKDLKFKYAPDEVPNWSTP